MWRATDKMCIRDSANPVLLEPIMHVEISVPDEYMGDIMGDLNKRRGRILGMEPVSYTHLDVYKRQRMNSGRPITANGRPE